LEEEGNNLSIKKNNIKQNNNFKIILATASPRRKAIIEKLKLDFFIVTPENVSEKKFKSPYTTVLFNANLKAQNVYNRVIINNLNKIKYKKAVIAGFDTVVYLDREILGKPKNKYEAEEILKKLSDKYHFVITGVALIDVYTNKIVRDYEKTKVKFKNLNDDEINNYLKIENVFDKAGAYDISGFGSILVEKICGCFYNIAGFPVSKFLKLLEELGYKII